MATKLISDLITEAQQLANRVDSNWNARTLLAINRALKKYAKHAPWDGLLRQESFLSPGGRYMVFPDRVMRVRRLGDSDNSIPLKAGEQWSQRYPGTFFQQSGTQPFEWRPVASVPVIASPTTDTALELQTTASDGMTVSIRGLARDTNASGTALELYEVFETVAMGGTGATNTTNIYVEVLEISKEKDSTASLLVRSATSSALLARIPPWEASSQYQRIELFHPSPVARNFLTEYYCRPQDITSTDHPLDPSIDTEYVVWQAAGDLHWAKQEAQAANAAWAKAEQVLAKQRIQELAHGDRDSQMRPSVNYQELEDDGAYWHYNG
jgi:hypothetical protein